MKKIVTIMLMATAIFFTGCKKKIEGCTDASATNYNAKATDSDGSCKYAITGCTDPTAYNYNPAATISSGCVPKIFGCMDPEGANYNPSANTSDGSCKYNGQLLFWTNADGGFQIKVTVNGQTGYITQFYSAADPTCGSSGCAAFTLPEGTYNYYANEVGGSGTWSGQRTVFKDYCNPLCLVK